MSPEINLNVKSRSISQRTDQNNLSTVLFQSKICQLEHDFATELRYLGKQLAAFGTNNLMSFT